MVTINKEDFAWQGRFLSPKLLSQMFLHCPSPRASPLVPHQGLLPPDRGPSSSEKMAKKRDWRKLGLSLPEISHERFNPPCSIVFSLPDKGLPRQGAVSGFQQGQQSGPVEKGRWRGTRHSHVGSAGVSF